MVFHVWSLLVLLLLLLLVMVNDIIVNVKCLTEKLIAAMSIIFGCAISSRYL